MIEKNKPIVNICRNTTNCIYTYVIIILTLFTFIRCGGNENEKDNLGLIYFSEANEAYENGDLDRALQYYNKFIASKSDKGDEVIQFANLRMAEINFALGNYDQAIICSEKVVSSDLHIGIFLLDKDTYVDYSPRGGATQEEDMDEIFSLGYSIKDRAAKIKGISYLYKNEGDLAIESFEDIREDSESYFYLALAYGIKGNEEEVRDYLNKNLKSGSVGMLESKEWINKNKFEISRYLSKSSNYNNVKNIMTLSAHKQPVGSLTVSPDGKTIASGSGSFLWADDGPFEIILWNVEDGSIIRRLTGHMTPITDICFNHEGNLLASSDRDGKIIIWNMKGDEDKIILQNDNWINNVRFSNDGTSLFADEGIKKKIKIWSINEKKVIGELFCNQQVDVIDVSPDGELLAAGCYNELQIWSLKSNSKIDDKKFNNSIHKVLYSQDSQMLVVCSGDEINLINSNSLEEIGILKGHFRPVLSVSLDQEQKLLISGSSDQMIKIWNLQTYNEIVSIVNEHKGIIYSVSFITYQNKFVSCGDDRTVKIWEY